MTVNTNTVVDDRTREMLAALSSGQTEMYPATTMSRPTSTPVVIRRCSTLFASSTTMT